MLEPLNIGDAQVKRLLEMGFMQVELDFFRAKNFSLDQLEFLTPIVWKEETTPQERDYYVSVESNEAGSFSRGRFTRDRLRELSSLGYTPEQLIEFHKMGYTTRDMIKLSEGCLVYGQIANLKAHLKKNNQQILAMSKAGLSAIDFIDLTLWGLPNFQREGLERLGLKGSDLYDIREQGLKELELSDKISSSKPFSVVFSRQPSVKGILRTGKNEDAAGNLDYEFVFRQGKLIWTFPDIRAPNSPLNLEDVEKQPLYLCKGLLGTYALPFRNFVRARRYDLKSEGIAADEYRRLDASLIAHKL